jgi:EKC/KEOPS complex subunit PCC1/LAGE3
MRAIAVDKELSALVSRSFSLTSAQSVVTAGTDGGLAGTGVEGDGDKTVLEVRYAATTNRMLRVAVNGFFESLRVVLHVMEELDVDVVGRESAESLVGIQGLEEV